MKRSFSVLVILALLLALVPASLAEGVTEITLWSMYTGDDYYVMQELVDTFNAQNADVKVTHVAMNADTDLYVKLPLVVGDASAAPHMSVLHFKNMPLYAEQGVILPISDFLTAYGDFSDDLYYGASQGYWKDVRYTIPFGFPITMVYVNNALAEQYCPEIIADDLLTWDEMYATAEKLVADGVTDVKLIGTSFPRNDMSTLYSILGGTYGTDGETVSMNKDILIQAVNLWKGLYDMGEITEEEDDAMGMFALEELIFVTGGTWNQSAVKEYGFEFTMLPFIQNTDVVEDMKISYSPEAFAVINRPITEAEQIGCLRFLEFVRENAFIWASSGAVVAPKVVRDSAEYAALPQSNVTKVIKGEMAQDFMYSGVISNVFREFGLQAVYGYITAEEYADGMQVKGEQAVEGARID